MQENTVQQILAPEPVDYKAIIQALTNKTEALAEDTTRKRNLQTEFNNLRRDNVIKAYKDKLHAFLITLNMKSSEAASELDNNKLLQATNALVIQMSPFEEQINSNKLPGDAEIDAARKAIETFREALPSLTTNQKLLVAGYTLAGGAAALVVGFCLGAIVALLIGGAGSGEAAIFEKFWDTLINSGLMDALSSYYNGPLIVGSILGGVGGLTAASIIGLETALNFYPPLWTDGQAVASKAGIVVNNVEYNPHRQVF